MVLIAVVFNNRDLLGHVPPAYGFVVLEFDGCFLQSELDSGCEAL